MRKPAKRKRKMPARKQLVVEYNVTGLSNAQIETLASYAFVQRETSDYGEGDDHPDVKATVRRVTRGKCKLLVIRYDVTGLARRQIVTLTGQAIAQAEGNDPDLGPNNAVLNVVYPHVRVSTKIV